jgi:hypothetical protein
MLMKTLKFRPEAISSILRGKQDATWRLFDDKNLSVGDTISMLDSDTGEEFAIAKITSVKETVMGKLSYSDFEGHDKFPSEEAMYKLFSGYCKCPVGKDTPVKVVKFRLI